MPESCSTDGGTNLVRINPLRSIQVFVNILCPKCKKVLSVVGLDDPVLWCSHCKQGFFMELRKANVKEADIKDVVGFPKDSGDIGKKPGKRKQ